MRVADLWKTSWCSWTCSLLCRPLSWLSIGNTSDGKTPKPSILSKSEKSHLGHLSWVCDALRRMQLRLGAHGVDIALYCSRVDAVGLPLETLLGHNGFHRKAVVIGPGDPARGHGGNVLSPQRPNSCEWLKLAQANAEPLQTL